MLCIYAILQFLSIFMNPTIAVCAIPDRMFCLPYLPRQILANAQEMEVEAVVEDHAGIFGRLTAVPAGQGGVRSAGEILSAMVNQTRRENLSAFGLLWSHPGASRELDA